MTDPSPYLILTQLSARLCEEVIKLTTHPELCSQEMLHYHEKQCEYVCAEALRLGIKLNDSI